MSNLTSESSLLQAEQLQLSLLVGEVLHSLVCISGGAPTVPCLSCTEDATDTVLQVRPHQSRGAGITSLHQLTAHLWMQSSIQLALWAGRAHCWLMSSSNLPVLPDLTGQDYAQCFHPPACFGGVGSLIPAADPPLGFLEPHEVHLCPLLSVLRSLWMALLYPTAQCH